MSLKYDAFNRLEIPRIYLVRPDGKTLHCLNGVQETSVDLLVNLNDINELTFVVDKYVEIEGELVQSNGYGLLKSNMYIKLDGVGLFRMLEPVEIIGSHNEYKEVTAHSVECELQGRDLVGFKINCGTEDSLEYIATGNVEYDEVLGIDIVKEYITIYNPDNPELSLLDLSLKQTPSWNIGYVDPLIRNKKTTFDIDSQDIYSFFTQTVSSFAQCMFDFDCINRLVNVYAVDSVGLDTNIYISHRNLANQVEVSCSEDTIYTRFNVIGSDDLTVRYVNFGDNRIENISYFLQTSYMSQELIDKYKNWHEYRESFRDEYIAMTEKYNAKIEEASEIVDRVPNDNCEIDWTTYSDEELAQALETNKNIAKILASPWTNSNGVIDMVEFQKQPEYIDWDIYTNVIIKNIEIEIANRKLSDSSQKKSYIQAIDVNLGAYGIDELDALLDKYSGLADTLSEKGYGKPWSQLTSSERNGKSQNAHDTNYKLYTQYKEKIKKIEAELAKRNSEYDAVMLEAENCDNRRKAIVKDVDISHERFGFTQQDILTINKLYTDTDFTNENLDVTATTIEQQKELLKSAKERLEIESQPQYSFAIDMENMLNIEEFKPLHNQLKVGNFIRVCIANDSYYVKVRIVSYQYNPCDKSSNISIEFSNIIKGNGKRNDFMSLLDSNSGSSKNSITGSKYSSSSSSTTIELSDSIIKALANSNAFGNVIKDAVLDSITAKDGNFDVVVSDYVKTNELVASVANISELSVDSAFIKYLEAGLIVAEKIEAVIVNTETIKAINGKFENIETNYLTTEKADIKYLTAEKADLKYLIANEADLKYATIVQLEATDANITNLTSEVADITTLLTGNITSDNIHSIILTADKFTATESFVKTQIANKIIASDIFSDRISTNEFTIGSDSGNLTIADSTIQIKDKNQKVRIQMGEDATGNFTFSVFDATGTGVLIDSTGVKEGALADNVIKQRMITNGAINSDKIDWTSFSNYVNAEGSNVINISEFTINEGGLSYKLGNMVTKVTDLENKTMYSVEVTSSTGLYVDNTTQLTAKVMNWNEDVTHKFQDSQFIWTRNSNNSASDEIWNAKNITGKTIQLSNSDLEDGAEFVCTINY